MLTKQEIQRDKANCYGGWSFCVLGMGAVTFLPATVITGLYIKSTLYQASVSIGPLKMVGLSVFTLALVLIMIGIGLCVKWMKITSVKRRQMTYLESLGYIMQQENEKQTSSSSESNIVEAMTKAALLRDQETQLIRTLSEAHVSKGNYNMPATIV